MMDRLWKIISDLIEELRIKVKEVDKLKAKVKELEEHAFRLSADIGRLEDEVRELEEENRKLKRGRPFRPGSFG